MCTNLRPGRELLLSALDDKLVSRASSSDETAILTTKPKTFILKTHKTAVFTATSCIAGASEATTNATNVIRGAYHGKEAALLDADITPKPRLRMTGKIAFLAVICLLCASVLLFTKVAGPRLVENIPYYTVAVFEHAYMGNKSDGLRNLMLMNLEVCEKAAEVAAGKGADMIVFPEFGILPYVKREESLGFLETIPDPQIYTDVNPCLNAADYSNDSLSYRLSCMAKNNHLVVVANIVSIDMCNHADDTNCPDDGFYSWNTNVAFDDDGTLIGRYCKEHLFFELDQNVPKPQNPIFTTKFGRFAMFICFDTIYTHIVTVAARDDVDGIILSALWMTVTPTMNSGQFFQAWAMTNNVTYIVSNLHIRGLGGVGSGVFGPKGVISFTYNPDEKSKLIVSKVPRSKHQQLPPGEDASSITIITKDGSMPYDVSLDGKDVPDQCSQQVLGPAEDFYKDFRCRFEEITVNYTFVRLTKLEDQLNVCNNGMCCSLNYSAQSMDETYYLGVHNGSYNLFNRYFWCQENCFVIRCEAINGSVCGTFPLRSNTVFNKIELRANFTTNYIYPSVVKSSVRLAPISEWHYDREGSFGHLNYSSSDKKPLLVAGLNGRCYQRDPPYVR